MNRVGVKGFSGSRKALHGSLIGNQPPLAAVFSESESSFAAGPSAIYQTGLGFQ
jgi:hypothetical protein